MPRPARFALLFVVILLLAACAIPRGASDRVLATALLPAPAGGERRVLVVVLPGRGDDLEGLRRSGIAQAVQQGWPEADVLLAEVTLPFYRSGRMPQKLQQEIEVAQGRRPYAETWLVGASMGGMGVLLYDHSFPGEVDGLVLLAPYLGDADLIAEIRAAGLAAWTPGPAPAVLDEDNYQRELWRDIQAWPANGRGERVWLAYGADDRLAAAMPPLVSALPPAQVRVRDGGHRWTVWAPAAAEIFAAVRAGSAGRSVR